MTKTCSECKQPKDLSLFYRDGSRPDGRESSCKDCKKTRLLALPDETKKARREYQAKWAKEHPGYQTRWKRLNKNRIKGGRLSSIYGITHERFLAMRLEQGDACAICRKPFGTPHVDHNHITKTVRGLLCQPCNVGLGFFRDSPEFLQAAARYLLSAP